jgi:hypothetical protein
VVSVKKTFISAALCMAGMLLYGASATLVYSVYVDETVPWPALGMAVGTLSIFVWAATLSLRISVFLCGVTSMTLTLVGMVPLFFSALV